MSGLEPESNGLNSRRGSGTEEQASLPVSNLELEHAVEKGLEIASSVACDILELVASGQLIEEQVELNGLVRTKTNADRISHTLFCERLAAEFPQCAILSEESRASKRVVSATVPTGHAHFVLDPIDGTIHLMQGDGQWLMNLAVVVDGIAQVGISVVPAKNRIYLGVSGQPSIAMNLDGSERTVLNNSNSTNSRIFGLCSPLDLGGSSEIYRKWEILAQKNDATATKEFGSAYSYLMVAEGQIDVFINPGGNFHWDTVAQQVILEGAGCRLVSMDWGTSDVSIEKLAAARYDLNFIKDNGHIAARKDMMLVIDPEIRMIWTPIFD